MALRQIFFRPTTLASMAAQSKHALLFPGFVFPCLDTSRRSPFLELMSSFNVGLSSVFLCLLLSSQFALVPVFLDESPFRSNSLGSRQRLCPQGVLTCIWAMALRPLIFHRQIFFPFVRISCCITECLIRFRQVPPATHPPPNHHTPPPPQHPPPPPPATPLFSSTFGVIPYAGEIFAPHNTPFLPFSFAQLAPFSFLGPCFFCPRPRAAFP